MDSDDRDRPEPAQPSCAAYRYEIRVQGHLDAHWSEWLEGMMLTHEEGGVTLLDGPVTDASALHGLFNKLLNLHVPILSLQRLEPVTLSAPLSGEPSEGSHNPS